MNKLKSGILAVMLFSMALSTKAQTPAITNSADIYRKLQKLNVLGTVLYFAAHPDDENTRLLAYLAKEKQYRTGYLSLTRGDGGQNLIGNEQGVELGLIRTQELLAARRIDGAEQMFSSAYDFGFSKSSDEALSIWGHDKILDDAVWLIRYYQPDVIITRFPGDSRAGHGHHSASAIIANEAFTAAADPSRFPEQLKNGIGVWKVKRILWNTFNFGGNNTTAEDQLKVDVGVYNPLLGQGYGEIASESRSQHKSQGFGVARQRGQSYEYFLTTGGDAPKKDLLDGVATSWTRVPGGDQVQPLIDQALTAYNFSHPEASVDALVNIYHVIQQLPAATPYRAQKLKEVTNLIVACSGIFAEATTGAAYAVKGDYLKVALSVNKRNEAPVTLKRVHINGWDTIVNAGLPVNMNWAMSYSFLVPDTQRVSQPYWLANPMNKGSFELTSRSDLNFPENQPAYNAVFTLVVKDLELQYACPVQCKYTDPVKGEIYEPVSVIAPFSLSLSPMAALLNVQPGNARTANPQAILQYKSNITAGNVPVSIHLLQGKKIIYSKDTVISVAAGNTYTEMIDLKKIFRKDTLTQITAEMRALSHQFTQNLRHIAYDHIPDINYYYTSNVKVLPGEIKTAGRRIGYISGAGDKVPQALEQMGYEVTLLDENDITLPGLKRFDAVLTGVRAYNVNEYLEHKYPVLMQYIQEGGNLIVQYCTSGGLRAKIAPYPMQVLNKRVTDENAAVKILLPQHPVLNYPNKITPADFEGWIQERSIYHADVQDSHYESPLAMNDKGESEHSGSLVIAPYGKGNFVYTGLVFFRELPAGVPGAFRLMANLIALPQHK